MIVVVDSNVWISAMLFGSPASIPNRALQSVVREHVIAISAEMRYEIVRVLADKGLWERDRIEAVLQVSLQRAVFVTLTHSTQVCRDAKDDMFLECAALAKADLLMTGDRDLLELKAYQGTQIIAPAEYILLHQERLGASSSGNKPT